MSTASSKVLCEGSAMVGIAGGTNAFGSIASVCPGATSSFVESSRSGTGARVAEESESLVPLSEFRAEN